MSNKKDKPIVVDSSRRWIVVFASFMIHFIMDGITYSMGQVFLEPMLKELNLSRALVSGIFSILPAVTLGTGEEQLRPSTPTNLAAGACLASLGLFLSRWWANIWFYYITIGVVGGLGFSLMYLPSIVCVEWHFESECGFAMGVVVSGSGVGTSPLFYVMDGLVHKQSRLHYSNGLLVKAAIILCCIFFGLMMTPHSQPSTEEQPIDPNPVTELLIGSQVAAVQPAKKSFAGQIIEQLNLKLFANGVFGLFIGANFLASLGLNVVYNFADDVANDSQILKNQRTHIIMSIGLTNILGRFVFGFLSDKVNRVALLIVTLLVSGKVTMNASPPGSSVIPRVGYASLFGLFFGVYVTLQCALLEDIVGKEKLTNGLGLLFGNLYL